VAEPPAVERVAEFGRQLDARLADLDTGALTVVLRFARAAGRSTEVEMVAQRGWQT